MAIAWRIGYGKKIAFGDYKNKNGVKKEKKERNIFGFIFIK